MGDKIKARCDGHCLSDSSSVYGASPYSAESAVCLSAFHAGVMGPQGGSFEVEIVASQKSYASSLNNGVKSRAFFESGAFAFSFTSQSEKRGFEPFAGQMVDILVAKTYEQGIVVQSKKRDAGFSLTIQFNNLDKVEMQWPSETVFYCGEKIKGRQCDARSQASPDAFKADVCFGPTEHCLEG